MFTRRNLMGLTLALAGMVVLAGNFSQAEAGSGRNSRGVGIRLIANMRSGATRATAKYEERDNARRKFTFELEKGTPGTVITVKHNGVILATRQVDSFGRAKVDFDTNIGSGFPVMTKGQVISVWVRNTQFMSGTLQ